MMKHISLLVFALVCFSFSANAQACEKGKTAACCSKKKVTATAVKADNNAVTTKAVLVNAVASKETTEKFTVYGNCGMCERAIENTLKLAKGVSKADWDKKTDELTVIFDAKKITLDEIKQKVADIGYDSDTHRAKDVVYNNLPGCCQYDRPTN